MSKQAEVVIWKGSEKLRGLLVPIDSLAFDPKNIRDHDEVSFEGIRKSLEKFGQVKTIVSGVGGVVVAAGNGTLEAAKRLGWTHLAVADTDHLSPEEVRGFALADNRTAELSSWKYSLLAPELKALDAVGIRSIDLGWTPKELKEVGRRAEKLGLQRDLDRGAGDGDTGEPLSKLGEVYELGRHRLLCGDATDAAAVQAFVGKAQQLLTDPPYGVDYGSAAGEIENDNLDIAGLTIFLRKAVGAGVSVLVDGGTVYVCAPAGPQNHAFSTVLTELGVWRQTLMWVKSSLVLGLSDYHYRHEVIFYGWRPGEAHARPTTRTEDSVWEFDKPARNDLHPTMKPVALYERAMLNGSAPGDVVVDLFAGSGTVVIAAETTGRTARAIELSTRYCDRIRHRWGSFAREARVDPGSGAL